MFILVPYFTYGDTCSSTAPCSATAGLSCPSTATGCNCPTTLTANQCDCPTTHYWDSSSSTCVVRVSEGGTCIVGKDYMCI